MHMRSATVFDGYGSINTCRRELLERLLAELMDTHELETALDAGCGVGFFSQCLMEMGMTVTAFDARPENVTEAAQRCPGVAFHIYNVEDPEVLELERVDVVLCFGLLYHLENPFAAVRNLCALTKKLIAIESRVAPNPLPTAILVDEGHLEDQSLHYIAFVPSEACLVKMLYRAGFEAVYKPYVLPDHDDFRESLEYSRRRTILVASKVRLISPTLQQLPEPQTLDIWRKSGGYHAKRLLWFLKEPLKAKLRILKNLARRRLPSI